MRYVQLRDPISAARRIIDTRQTNAACADSSTGRSVTLDLTYAPYEPHIGRDTVYRGYLCCLCALPLGCWAHCHSNCCRPDLSCTSLKLIASHSIHFTNMRSNYYFARVIIKWESIGNKRGEMANIPGICRFSLNYEWGRRAKFLEFASTSSHLKRGGLLDGYRKLWSMSANTLIHTHEKWRKKSLVFNVQVASSRKCLTATVKANLHPKFTHAVKKHFPLNCFIWESSCLHNNSSPIYKQCQGFYCL